MKTFSILCLLSILLPSKSFSQQMTFKSVKQNFGFVHQGGTVHLNYELTNTGDKPLIISNYEVECGCTVMKAPENPIPPGEKYVLQITFDTHQKYDRQDRTVKVISNAVNSPVILRFKGVVLKPKEKK
jgi:hypothetical protein